MGLLDDAIREHLDLKRRRGADPTEVEREEREVLGPVRRRGEEAPDGELEPEFLHEDDLDDEPLPHDSTSENMHSEDVGVAEAPAPAAAFDHEQIASREPEREPYSAIEDRPAPFAEHSDAAEQLHAAEPLAAREPLAEPEPEPEARLYRQDVGHEPPAKEETTAEYNVEDALQQEHSHPEREEDVLEETPEFLQDTPDHDRLWFEQRPPRDFDFDG